MEEDNTVGFGTRAQDTWRQIWDTRADGYAFFIIKQKCVPGSKMYNLQQYLLKQQQQQLTINTPPVPPPSASTARPLVSSSTASDQPGKLIKFMQMCLYCYLKPTDPLILFYSDGGG